MCRPIASAAQSKLVSKCRLLSNDSDGLSEGRQYSTRQLTAIKNTVVAGLHSLPPGGAIGLALQTLSAVKSEFTPLYPAEVERLIQQMPAKTSPLDAVPVSVLKQCRTEMAVVIANLPNVSFKSDRFLSVMKHGIVRRQQSARQLRHSLHWLPLRTRTDFKLTTLSDKSRMTGQPDYLAAELHSYQPQLFVVTGTVNCTSL